MKQQYNMLAEHIKKACSGINKIYYLANDGNHGDALIRIGTLAFFNDYKIDIIEITPLDLSKIQDKSSILIYGGGGAWCQLWNHSAKIVSRSLGNFRKTIVLPSTYEDRYYYPNVDFFIRDNSPSSYIMPHAQFCHDMAFYLKLESQAPEEQNGYFFRIDEESLGKIKFPSSNEDISLKGKHYSPIEPFVKKIQKYKVIYTDRLHVGICASLLGRELHLFPGRYFKNQAIFNSSIKSNFTNVHFHEDFSIINNMAPNYSL